MPKLNKTQMIKKLVKAEYDLHMDNPHDAATYLAREYSITLKDMKVSKVEELYEELLDEY